MYLITSILRLVKMIFNVTSYSNDSRLLTTWIRTADEIVLTCFIGAISNTAINISLSLLGLDYLRGNFVARVTGRARRFMIPFIEVQWWSIRSQRRFELHGGQKITHLTYSPIHLSPFFSPLLCLLQDTPSFLEWTTICRRGTRYLSPPQTM